MELCLVKIRSRGEKVRAYILENVEKFPETIAKEVAGVFQISRQAANKHLKNLVDEGVLVHEGNTRRRTYKLCPLAEDVKIYPLDPDLQEDVVWRNDVRPFLGQLPENMLDIW